MNKQQIKEILENMSVDELVGQVINLNLAWPQYDEKESGPPAKPDLSRPRRAYYRRNP